MHTATQIAEIANPNHPKPGDTIKVEPIRTVNAINNLKKYLAPSPGLSRFLSWVLTLRAEHPNSYQYVSARFDICSPVIDSKLSRGKRKSTEL